MAAGHVSADSEDIVTIDLHVADPDAKIEQLLALGATKLWDGRLGPQTWVTLADPEGNELCVS